jgi:hypothetical protein
VDVAPATLVPVDPPIVLPDVLVVVVPIPEDVVEPPVAPVPSIVPPGEGKAPPLVDPPIPPVLLPASIRRPPGPVVTNPQSQLVSTSTAP